MWKGYFLGEIYVIQGNILIGLEVFDGMEVGFLNIEGMFVEWFMAVMQGVNIFGVDVCCLDVGMFFIFVFLWVFKLDDDLDNFWLEFNVVEVFVGVEFIDFLQVLFDVWLLIFDEEVEGIYGFSVFFNFI